MALGAPAFRGSRACNLQLRGRWVPDGRRRRNFQNTLPWRCGTRWLGVVILLFESVKATLSTRQDFLLRYPTSPHRCSLASAKRPSRVCGYLRRVGECRARPRLPLSSLALESCPIPETEDYEIVPQDPVSEQLWDLFKVAAIFILPLAGPTIAYALWPLILLLVHYALGEEKSLLELTQMTLNPTTNGIVVACLATALGTLTSVTVWTLRQRQLDVRASLNKEACDLNLLRMALAVNMSPIGQARDASADSCIYVQVLALLRQYTARVALETSKRADARRLERQDVGNSELAGIVQALCQTGAPRDLRQDVIQLISSLNGTRSGRLAQLSTAFPFIHWVILALLASSIALCFLIEVDQSEGRFFLERPEDSLRLRLIFTILVGTFSGLAALCADLNDPFRGSFNIIRTTDQFFVMQKKIDKELEAVLFETNPSLTRGDVERSLKAADDGTGSVDYGEFASMLERQVNTGT